MSNCHVFGLSTRRKTENLSLCLYRHTSGLARWVISDLSICEGSRLNELGFDDRSEAFLHHHIFQNVYTLVFDRAWENRRHRYTDTNACRTDRKETKERRKKSLAREDREDKIQLSIVSTFMLNVSAASFQRGLEIQEGHKEKLREREERERNVESGTQKCMVVFIW